MFRSVRLRKPRLIIILPICLCLLCAVGLFALKTGVPDTVGLRGEEYSLLVGSDGDIEAFVRACGFEPEGVVSDREITVPEAWNDVYTAYCEMQLAQGFDLAPYKGATARELTCASADSDEYITLLISGGRIIAGHRSRMDGGKYEPLTE